MKEFNFKIKKLSGIEFDSMSEMIVEQEVIPVEIIFNEDETKMYVLGNCMMSVFQYTLKDIDGKKVPVYDDISLDVTEQDVILKSLDFNEDYTEMYIRGGTIHATFRYNLAIAGNIGTAKHDGIIG